VSKPVFHGRVTFEHDTLSLALCLGWKIHSSHDYTPYNITRWSVIPIAELVFSRQLSCHQYVQRDVQPEKPSVTSAISAVFKHSIASAIPESVLNHLLLLSASNLVTCFVSLMEDTLRPSCDESFPIHFNSLSRN
jgi:hypothetical protein